MSAVQSTGGARSLGPDGAFYVAFWSVATRAERGKTYDGPAGLWCAVCFLRTIAESGHLVAGTIVRVELEHAQTAEVLYDHAAGVDKLPICPRCRGPWCMDWPGHLPAVQNLSGMS